jgi:hypothetical protein
MTNWSSIIRGLLFIGGGIAGLISYVSKQYQENNASSINIPADQSAHQDRDFRQ